MNREDSRIQTAIDLTMGASIFFALLGLGADALAGDRFFTSFGVMVIASVFFSLSFMVDVARNRVRRATIILGALLFPACVMFAVARADHAAQFAVLSIYSLVTAALFWHNLKPIDKSLLIEQNRKPEHSKNASGSRLIRLLRRTRIRRENTNKRLRPTLRNARWRG